MKTIITILILFISLQLFSQNVNKGFFDTTNLKEFKIYFNKICNEESDKSIDMKDSLTKYRVVFTSQGEFIDTKHQLIRLCNVKNIKKASFFAEVFFLKNKHDSLSSYFMSNSCETIKTCPLNNLWGEQLADSLINILSIPSFWASCISAKLVRFSQDISIGGLFNTINKKSSFDAPSIMSYHDGKYLIVDLMAVMEIGDQTDKGNFFSCFLERVE